MKSIVRTLLLIIACCNTAVLAHAQAVSRSTDTVKKTHPAPYVKPKGPKPIKNEMSVGVRLNSNGWSIYTDIGKVKSKDPKRSEMFHNVSFFQIEFTEKKNPGEQKSVSDNPTGTGSDSYIYGKINNFYAVKLAWGYRKMLAGKPDPGTVSIHWVNAGGISVGLLKPYYLNVYSDPAAIQYSDATASDFLNRQVIEGRAGFTKGLNQITVIPGAHFKSALHFDFSTNKKNVLGVETGMNVEYYSKAVPMLADQTGSPLFFDIFIAFQYGRRW